MPVIGIAFTAIGSSIGTAAFAGTALAGVGGYIGAGIAGGLYSSSQGGDFGKGFLMSAVGSWAGAQLGEAFGGIGGGAGGMSEAAFQAADAASLMGTTDAFGNLLGAGAVGQNMGAAAGNWGGVNAAAMAGMGDFSANDFAGVTGEIAPAAGETGMTASGDFTGPTNWEQDVTGYTPGKGMTIGVDNMGTPTTDAALSNPYSEGVAMPTGDNGSLAELNAYSERYIDPQSSYPKLEGNYNDGLTPGSLENIASTDAAPASGGNPAGVFPQQSTGYMDKLKGWMGESDSKLAQFGMPKGSTAVGMLGAGQYLMGNYETYKAEQIAKGMKPLTLEEYQNKMYNPNDYKVAANSMAQAGRTGTLPVLLARMKQQSSMDYNKNYLPNANKNWWNTNANISQMKMNNLGNLTQPLSMSWAMNKAQQ